MLAGALVCAGALLASASHATGGTPAGPSSFADVRAAYISSEALLLDRYGVPLSEVRVNAKVRQLEWTALADVSPALSSALIAAEDKRFYAHDGVDWPGMAVAAWDSLWRSADGRRPRGGSTLTMQLVGLLDPALRPSGGEPRTLAQKWNQVSAARALERTWTKAQILEAYLNLSSFRGELRGLSAATHGLFGKTPAGVDAREAAILVALLRAPGARPALVAQRACAVAAAVTPDVPCEPIRALASVSLAGRYRLPPRWNLAPHLAARMARIGGERVATTLDASLQAHAIATLRDHLSELTERGVEDGAIVVLDTATGDVLAYVGSSGELSGAAEVDGVTAPRQAGSTLKPFLYALAFDQNLLTAASLVDDSPLVIATERGMYVPQNYDRNFHGSVSVRTALASSLNVPAVRTLNLVGLDRFHDTLRALHFDTLTQPDDYYGSSLALGGADVTLLALTNAYRALANGGVVGQPRMRADAKPEDSRRIYGRAASFIVTDILADRSARAITFGLENPLATRVWSAAKTGTSKDMRDNWCIGYTSRYTVGVWVGNFSGAPMRDVSGVTGAAPIWRDIVHWLHRTETSAEPVVPAGVARRTVNFDPAIEAERREWFVGGTAMVRVRASNQRGDDDRSGTTGTTPQIRYPAPGTIIALDPDIPPAHQRVAFAASPTVPDMRWKLDDTEMSDRHGQVLWAPTPGRHALVLQDARGTVLSRVDFEVRGGVSAAAMAAR
jgi:penicillin-binding protein 1C